ncbi:MAG: hypothetical protein ACE15E_17490 [Acidobacteriota bacterium]
MTQTGRLLLTWTLLLLAGVLALAAIGLAYRNVDLRLSAVAGALVVPLIQTLTFWAPGAWRSLRTAPARHVPAHPLFGVALVNDLVALALVWGAGDGFLQAETALKLCSWYMGVRAFAAAAALACTSFPRFPRWRGRLLIGAWSLGLLVWGLDYFFPFLTLLPGLLFPDYPVMWRAVLTWSPLFAAAALATIGLERLFDPRSQAAGACLALVPLCALTAVIVIAVDVFNTPDLTLVSRRVLASLSLIGIAAIWHAAWSTAGGTSSPASETI